MKRQTMLDSWLMVPLAVAAGLGGSQWRQRQPTPAVSGAEAAGKPAAREVPPHLAPARQSLVNPAAGTVKKWADRLRGCPVGELPALLEEIDRIQTEARALPQAPDQVPGRLLMMNEHQTALRLLCARWAELDAPGGFAYFNQRKAEGKDSDGRTLLLAEWALRDQDTVFQTIQTLPSRDRAELLSSVGAELLPGSPEVFRAWFQKARRPLPSNGFAVGTWNVLAREHFEELSALGVQMAEDAAGEKQGAADGLSLQSWELQGLFTLLGNTLAERDPDKALAWAKDQPGKMRAVALEAVIKNILKRAPEKLPEYLALLKPLQSGPGSGNAPGSGELVRAAVEEMASRDPLKTLNWLRENHSKLPGDSSEAVYSLGGRLAEAIREGRLTPQQALGGILAPDASPADRDIGVTLACSMWKNLPASQLAEAAGWLLTENPDDRRNFFLQKLFPEWMQQDEEAAMKFADAVKDPRVARQLYEGLASKTTAGDRDTQLERLSDSAAKIPPAFRADFLADQLSIAYGDWRQDNAPPFNGPLMAKSLEGLPPSQAADRALETVAEVWGTTDPVAAVTWASGQAEARTREKSLGGVIEAWSAQDGWGASQWIADQPPGEQRDIASHHLARALRESEPESAWTWAGSISDPEIRLEARAAVLRKWRNSSAADARGAVSSLGQDLPPAELRKLTDTLEHRDGGH